MPEIKLHIKILTTPIYFSVEQMIAAAKEIFITAGIEINIDSTEKLNSEDEDLSLLNDIYTEDCMMGSPSPDQVKLSVYRGNAEINEVVAFFCRSVFGNSGILGGCASYPQNNPMFAVSSTCSKYTFAHELGHVLGLTHVFSPNRLMTLYGTDNIRNPPPDIIQREIDLILTSNFII